MKPKLFKHQTHEPTPWDWMDNQLQEDPERELTRNLNRHITNLNRFKFRRLSSLNTLKKNSERYKRRKRLKQLHTSLATVIARETRKTTRRQSGGSSSRWSKSNSNSELSEEKLEEEDVRSKEVYLHVESLEDGSSGKEEVEGRARQTRTYKETASKTRLDTKKEDGAFLDSILPSYEGDQAFGTSTLRKSRLKFNINSKSQTKYIGSVQSIDFGLPKLVTVTIFCC